MSQPTLIQQQHEIGHSIQAILQLVEEERQMQSRFEQEKQAAAQERDQRKTRTETQFKKIRGLINQGVGWLASKGYGANVESANMPPPTSLQNGKNPEEQLTVCATEIEKVLGVAQEKSKPLDAVEANSKGLFKFLVAEPARISAENGRSDAAPAAHRGRVPGLLRRR